MLLEDQGSGLSFLPVVLRVMTLCPYYVSLSLPWLCSVDSDKNNTSTLQFYTGTVTICRYSNLYNLIISWHMQQCCLIKTIGSSDTSKTTKTSFSIFSRWFSCCLYSLWFNIQQSTTCTRKHTKSSAHSCTHTETDFTRFPF